MSEDLAQAQGVEKRALYRFEQAVARERDMLSVLQLALQKNDNCRGVELACRDWNRSRDAVAAAGAGPVACRGPAGSRGPGG